MSHHVLNGPFDLTLSIHRKGWQLKGNQVEVDPFPPNGPQLKVIHLRSPDHDCLQSSALRYSGGGLILTGMYIFAVMEKHLVSEESFLLLFFFFNFCVF